MTPDGELLRQYAEAGDEAAFAELVRRHLPVVYGTALRLLHGDAHRAQDVAQGVFTDLARKAGSLTNHPTLAGWLHTSTRFLAGKTVRGELRRQAREAEAATMSETTTTPEVYWAQLEPLLDEGLAQLPEADRDAILLRFFEEKSYAEVGALLNLDESTARKRVERALDKMRLHFARDGLTASAALLSTTLGTHAATAVPDELAATVTGASLAGAGKAAALAATAAKGAAAAKGSGLLGLLGAFLLPVLAIFLGLFVSVDKAIREARVPPDKNRATTSTKLTGRQLTAQMAITLLLAGVAVYYLKDYPVYVFVVLAGLFGVHFVVKLWASPSGSRIRDIFKIDGEAALNSVGAVLVMACAKFYWQPTLTVVCVLALVVRYWRTAESGHPRLWKLAISTIKLGLLWLPIYYHQSAHSTSTPDYFVFRVILSFLLIFLIDKFMRNPKSGLDSATEDERTPFTREARENRQKWLALKQEVEEKIKQVKNPASGLNENEKKREIAELRRDYRDRHQAISRATVQKFRLAREAVYRQFAVQYPHLPDRPLEYCSRWSLAGWPLIHINFGRTSSGGAVRAKGWLAIGTTAAGIVAIASRAAVGVISFGVVFSLGLIGLGGVTIGVYAIGCLAFGFQAVGAFAYSYQVLGVFRAVQSFFPYAQSLFELGPLESLLQIYLVGVLPAMVVLWSVEFFWVRQGIRKWRILRKIRAEIQQAKNFADLAVGQRQPPEPPTPPPTE